MQLVLDWSASRATGTRVVEATVTFWPSLGHPFGCYIAAVIAEYYIVLLSYSVLALFFSMDFPTPPCKIARLANSVGIAPTSWGDVRDVNTNRSVGGDGLNLQLGRGSSHSRKSCGFTIFQLQELQLQSLIYKYMEARLPVPYHLLVPIWKSVTSLGGPNGVVPPGYTSFLSSSPLSWDKRIRMDSDPEPGRCRRTDGKKWRCSNEAVPQKKYCERHMQRCRQRSRKLVETSQPINTSTGVSPSSNTNLSISLSVNSSSSSCDLSP